MASPIAPFFMDQLFNDLNGVTQHHSVSSVHLADFPSAKVELINKTLEDQMDMAQKSCSLLLGLRKKQNIRVRQPLQKIMIPVLNEKAASNLLHVKDLILSEVNVKELELLQDSAILVKRIKPNFKTIGPKYGKHMKAIAALVETFSADEIHQIEINHGWRGVLNGEEISLSLEDFDITAQDIPGWMVASEGTLTVALDITLTDDLKQEGIARELVNRIQNLRKEMGFEVTDKIKIEVKSTEEIELAAKKFQEYIKDEVLAVEISLQMKQEKFYTMEVLSAEDTIMAIYTT